MRPTFPLVVSEPNLPKLEIKPIGVDYGPSGFLSVHLPASTRVEAYRAVWQTVSGGIAHLDPSVIEQRRRLLGISLDAASTGRTATVATSGILFNSIWNWQNGPVYVSSDGVLVQNATIDPTPVAYALSSKMIRLGDDLNSINLSRSTQTLVWNSPSSSDTWLITHGLGRNPAVTIVDSAGNQILADVAYVDINSVRIDFAFPTGGTAYLI